jgi:ABC-type sugar transport system permease subunit
MYEVSQIEGATGYEAFWKITIPLVSPLILTNIVYTVVDIYTRSGIVNLAYRTAFDQNNLGLGSAMAVISSLSICLLLFITTWIVSRFVFYQN